MHRADSTPSISPSLPNNHYNPKQAPPFRRAHLIFCTHPTRLKNFICTKPCKVARLCHLQPDHSPCKLKPLDTINAHLPSSHPSSLLCLNISCFRNLIIQLATHCGSTDLLALSNKQKMMALRSCCLLIVAMSVIFLVLMESNAMAGSWQGHRQLRGSRQCRIQKLKASRPNQKLQAEGGTTELWDQTEEQFKCVGLAAMRNTIQPHCLSLPNYSPSPRLVYIEKGPFLRSQYIYI